MVDLVVATIDVYVFIFIFGPSTLVFYDHMPCTCGIDMLNQSGRDSWQLQFECLLFCQCFYFGRGTVDV